MKNINNLSVQIAKFTLVKTGKIPSKFITIIYF